MVNYETLLETHSFNRMVWKSRKAIYYVNTTALLQKAHNRWEKNKKKNLGKTHIYIW